MTRIIARTDVGAHGVARDWRAAVQGAYVDDMAAGRARAARLLLDARREARSIILDAQETVRASADAAMRQARQAGYAEGQAQAREELAATMGPLARLVVEAAADHAEGLRRLDEEALALSLAIARAVVKHEITLTPKTVLGVARAALEELSLSASVTIRVHPADRETLTESIPLLGLPPSLPISVVADPVVAQGGCVVESGAGRVDATLATQLDKIESLLHEQLRAATD